MSSFKVHVPQEIYQPVSFPVAVQNSLGFPQGENGNKIFAQNWYRGGSGFTGPQNLQTVLTALPSMQMIEHTSHSVVYRNQ